MPGLVPRVAALVVALVLGLTLTACDAVRDVRCSAGEEADFEVVNEATDELLDGIEYRRSELSGCQEGLGRRAAVYAHVPSWTDLRQPEAVLREAGWTEIRRQSWLSPERDFHVSLGKSTEGDRQFITAIVTLTSPE